VPPNKRGKKSEQSGDADVDVDDDDKNSKDPLSALTNKAGKSNPSQFELPKELTSHILLPGLVRLLASNHWLLKSKSFGRITDLCNGVATGSSKRRFGRDGRGQSKKLPHELDNGIVPLPAKLCFNCCKSVRDLDLFLSPACYMHLLPKYNVCTRTTVCVQELQEGTAAPVRLLSPPFPHGLR
jgi:hypothetical protein